VLKKGGWLALADHNMPRWMAGLLRSKARTAKGLRAIISEGGMTVTGDKRKWLQIVYIVVAHKE
jgi:hypothetical protein